MGLEKTTVDLAAATSVRDIIASLDKNNYDVAVIDSIQTVYSDQLSSAPGSVAQVRDCAAQLARADAWVRALRDQIAALPSDQHWQALARNAMLEELTSLQRTITGEVLNVNGGALFA